MTLKECINALRDDNLKSLDEKAARELIDSTLLAASKTLEDRGFAKEEIERTLFLNTRFEDVNSAASGLMATYYMTDLEPFKAVSSALTGILYNYSVKGEAMDKELGVEDFLCRSPELVKLGLEGVLAVSEKAGANVKSQMASSPIFRDTVAKNDLHGEYKGEGNPQVSLVLRALRSEYVEPFKLACKLVTLLGDRALAASLIDLFKCMAKAGDEGRAMNRIIGNDRFFTLNQIQIEANNLIIDMLQYVVDNGTSKGYDVKASTDRLLHSTVSYIIKEATENK